MRAVTSCLLLLSIRMACTVPPPMAADSLPDTTIRQEFKSLARNIDVDLSKQGLPKMNQKRRFVKHPLLITKEDVDPQDAVVEDNIIVESNVLRLVRPSAKRNEIPKVKRYDDISLVPHKRVTRGWNLQYVVVPQQYQYYKKKRPVKYYPYGY